MARIRLHMRIAVVLAFAAAAGQAAGSAATPADRAPYRTALAALDNYQSCGVSVDSPAFRALTAALQAGEAIARGKGLGPELERERARYQAILAVSTMVACAGGPDFARADAGRAVAAFRAWAAAQPAQ
jgi:hypothetical protein